MIRMGFDIQDGRQWVRETVRALLLLTLGICLLSLVSCIIPGPNPPVPPTPTPTPVGPPYAVVRVEDTLRSGPGGRGFTNLAGAPVDITWAESCCSDTLAGPFGWPGFNRAWIDFLKPYGVRGVHLRIGPFLAIDEANYQLPRLPRVGQPRMKLSKEYLHIGGAYLEVNGKADLNQWNPKFWEYNRDVVAYAVANGFWVEIDAIDGWGCKEGGYEHHPWSSQWNIQGEDALTSCGNTFGPRHAAFVTKMADELLNFGPMIIQDGNEIGIVGWGYRPEWTFAIRSVIRQREEANRYPVHLFGTNSGRSEAIDSPLTDYVTTHAREVLYQPIAAKPTRNNEHNPEYVLDVEYAAYCAAKAGGASWDLWAAGMERPIYEQLLAKVQAGCGDFNPDACPFEIPTIGAIQAKDHFSSPGKVLLDATPLVMGNSGYCRRAGFTDGRSNCPVRPEGDAFREQCEIAAMGGEISWTLPALSPFVMNVRHGGFQAEVTGASGASGTVYCSFPAAGGENKCQRPLSAGGGPVNVVLP